MSSLRRGFLCGVRVGEASSPGPRRRDQTVLETFNGSCHATCMDRVSRTCATVVFLQEHKCVTQEEIDRASGQWLEAGWKSALAPGIRTEKGGASGGTGVLVKKHIPVDYLKTQRAKTASLSLAEGQPVAS